MQYARMKRKLDTEFSPENFKQKDHLRDMSVDEEIILKCVSKKWDMRLMMGIIKLVIGTSIRYVINHRIP
jgi:hypothetical protein